MTTSSSERREHKRTSPEEDLLNPGQLPELGLKREEGQTLKSFSNDTKAHPSVDSISAQNFGPKTTLRATSKVNPNRHKGVHSLTYGKWSAQEHRAFLEAMELYGNAWRQVREYIGTRTSAQIRSHAQKYYRHLRLKAAREMLQDPKMKGAIFVVTQEYRVHTADSVSRNDPAASPVHVAAPVASAEIETHSTVNSQPPLLVPIPCYPIYVRPIPPEFKSVLTCKSPIPPFINSSQLLTPLLRQAQAQAQAAVAKSDHKCSNV